MKKETAILVSCPGYLRAQVHSKLLCDPEHQRTVGISVIWRQRTAQGIGQHIHCGHLLQRCCGSGSATGMTRVCPCTAFQPSTELHGIQAKESSLCTEGPCSAWHLAVVAGHSFGVQAHSPLGGAAGKRKLVRSMPAIGIRRLPSWVNHSGWPASLARQLGDWAK